MQDYEDESELVIVNDYEEQTIKFDHPKVKIYNTKRFGSIGEKENFAISKCSYPVIAVWDDDDIALRWHLKNIKEWFDGDLLHWIRGIRIDNGEVVAIGNVGNSGIVYSKEIFDKIGGMPLENAGYDVSFVNKVHGAKGKVVRATPDNPAWGYYWANRSYHMSGLGTDTGERPNVIERHSEHIKKLAERGEIPLGEIYLNPHWKVDYENKFVEFKKTENDS